MRVLVDLPSQASTARLARAIAHNLAPGDTLLLSGPIGAGKSHFARALITARLAVAGLQEDIPSPTYTLVQTYEDGRASIWHADLYRLGHVDELHELGLDGAFGSAICLVEWPDRLGPLTPNRRLEIALTPDTAASDHRSAEVTAVGDWPWLDAVLQAWDAAA